MEAKTHGANLRATALLMSLLGAYPAHTAWPSDPMTNVPVCTAPNNQYVYRPASDGAGGMFVAWQDYRSGSNYDVYAQHVLSAGVADPAWPSNGMAVCTAPGDQQVVQVVEDGSGGVIVAWQDRRSGADFKVYAQHLLPSGVMDSRWPFGGRAVCGAAGYQEVPRLVSDGAGGAIIAWTDGRGGTHGSIFAQHVLSSGAVDPAWPVNGRSLATSFPGAYLPQIVSDGAGGAIVIWLQLEGGFDRIRTQHLLASGLVDPAWPANGRAVSLQSGGNEDPQLVPSGSGGAIITWTDGRRGFYDIYAQHVLATGVVDPRWPMDGRLLSLAVFQTVIPQIAPDGSGGAIVIWRERRYNGYDVFSQHVLAGGDTDALWPVGGRPICEAVGDQDSPQLVSDGAGGGLVTWQDHRSANYDIYAQHVLPSGAAAPGWPVDGRALCTAAGDQTVPQLVPDGTGGAIAIWWDQRNGPTTDLYAQRTPVSVPVPTLASLVSANWTGAAVEVVWYGNTLKGARVSVYRDDDGAGFSEIATVPGDGEGFVRCADASVLPGHRYGYNAGFSAAGSEHFTDDVYISIPGGRLSIDRVLPNPVTGLRLGLLGSLSSTGPARVRILDLAGRVIHEQGLAGGTTGRIDILLADGARLEPGVYVVELRQAGERATRRFTYLK